MNDDDNKAQAPAIHNGVPCPWNHSVGKMWVFVYWGVLDLPGLQIYGNRDSGMVHSKISHSADRHFLPGHMVRRPQKPDVICDLIMQYASTVADKEQPEMWTQILHFTWWGPVTKILGLVKYITIIIIVIVNLTVLAVLWIHSFSSWAPVKIGPR
jgi:hypothetical protein